MILTTLRTYVNNTFGLNGIGGINGLMLKTALLEIINRLDTNFKGAWTANTAAVAGDMVTNGGNTYRRKADGTTGSSFNAGEYDLIAQGGAVADLAVTSAKLAQQGVIPEKIKIASIGMSRTSFLRPGGKNLFNILDAENKDGYYVDDAGAETALAGYTISHYIPVIAGTVYTPSDKQFVACYSANLTILAGFAPGRSTASFTTPASCVYVRLTIVNATLPTYQFEKSASATEFEKFNLLVDGDTAGGLRALSTALPAQDLGRRLSIGKNLFNVADSSNRTGYYVGTDGIEVAYATATVSHFIAVEPGATYTPSDKQNLAFYNQYQVALGTGAGAGRGSATFTVPASCYWIKLTILDTTLATYQVEKAGAATSWEPFKPVLSVDTPSGLKSLSAALPAQDFLRQATLSKNLFNQADKTNKTGFYVDTTGAEFANAAYTISHFIAVTAGQTYITNDNQFIAYYDPYQMPLRIGAAAGRGTLAITIPAGCAYVRLTIQNTLLGACQFEVGSVGTFYAPFKQTLPISTPEGSAALAIATDTATNFSATKNLYNKDATHTAGKYMTEAGSLVDDVRFEVSPLIPVEANTLYFANSVQFVTFFGANGSTVVGGVTYLRPSGQFSTNSTTAYIRATVPVWLKSAFQIEKSATQTSYEPFGRKATALLTPGYRQATGRTVLYLGTSIPKLSDAPVIAGAMVNALVINNCVPSAPARKAKKDGSIAGLPWDSVSRSLSASIAEKQNFIDNYATIQPTLAAGAPASLTAGDKAYILSTSYENLLLPYLNGTYPLPELIVLSHLYNDNGYGDTNTEFTTMPATRNDRNYGLGALNFLLDLIYQYNPRQRVVIEGHTENHKNPRVAQAQQVLADYWSIPIWKLWEELGWSDQKIPGTLALWGTLPYSDYAAGAGSEASSDMTAFRLANPDGTHPSSDTSGKSQIHYGRSVGRHLIQTL